MPAGSLGLEQLAQQLRQEAIVRDEVASAVRDSAKKIRDRWRNSVRNRSQYGHIPSLPAAITYDTYLGSTVFSATIGYDKNKRQGPLGNLLEFGSVNNPPGNEGGNALLYEMSGFINRMQKIADDFLD